MYSGFLLDEKNTRFRVIAVHMSALQEIYLLFNVVELINLSLDPSYRDSVRRDRRFAVGIFRRPPNLTYMSCTFTIYTPKFAEEPHL